MHKQNNNTRIAKNTLYLYIRMLVSMAITLYTSRVIINTLGIDDFGIYNIVGGIIVLFGFVSHSLRAATQRFVSFYIGQNNKKEINRSFNMSLQCHIIMALVLILLAETIGIWFVMYKLNIPTVRYDAVIWVFQFSLFTFIINLFQAPYYAVIVSYEKMSFYALISILDVILKLAVVYLLLFFNFDKLILYSVLLLLVSLCSLIVPMIYCYKSIGIGHFSIVKDVKLYKDIMGFIGWSMFNGSAFVVNQQGGNILLNFYNGVAANGAFGVANQVTNAVYGFVSNFQTAFNPQIVKYYSSGQYKELFALMNRAASFSYFLYLMLAIPFLSQTNFILSLWLGTTPEYASVFCQLLLIYFMVDAIQAPLWMLIGATGKIKIYSVYSGFIALLSLPGAWIMLDFGYSIYWVFIMRVILNILLGFVRPFYLRSLIPSFSLREYLNEAIKRTILVTLILVILLYIVINYCNNVDKYIIIILSFFTTGLVIWNVGINKKDRRVVVSIVKDKFKH